MVEPVNLEDFREKPSPRPLETGGRGGDSNGMDPWQQSIEDRLAAQGRKIDGNLLWALAAMGTGFIFLMTRLDGTEARLGAKVDKVGEQVSALASDVAVLKSGSPATVRVPARK